MDLLCDNIVEEILRRLPAKYLHRVRAVSRRFNDLVLSPGFVARYWQSHSGHLSGVFLQTESLTRPWGHFPDFLAGSPRPSATESIFASDLGFLPHVPKSQLQRPTMRDTRKIFIVHSTAGLLLCSRGHEGIVQYYVCNPVSWQWVSLPELPWRHYQQHGLLSVTDNGDGIIRCFQVFLFNQPMHWRKSLDLKVFSSDTGQWRATAIRSPQQYFDARLPLFLGESGTAYCFRYSVKDKVIAYNCNNYSIQVLPLPDSVPECPYNRCIGERQGGVLRYAHFDSSFFEVWDLRREGENGMCWTLVHQVGVMELAQQNLETATRAATFVGSTIQGRINSSLIWVLGFHPTEDIVYMDVANAVASYSMEQGTIRYGSPRKCFCMDVFSYVHPAHPVKIPTIKDTPLE
uniref:Uncharacterized protein n=2 Tax=Avena sativa TaxID=4498 RepID=A0ACD5X231_AVESA